MKANNALPFEFNPALSENLYDNGVSLTNLDSSTLRREIAELNYRGERDRLLLEVALEYMRYSLASLLYETQTRQFEIVNRQFKSVDSLFRKGVRTLRDDLKFKTETRRSEIDVQTARTAVEKSRVDLMRLIGLTNRTCRSSCPTPSFKELAVRGRRACIALQFKRARARTSKNFGATDFSIRVQYLVESILICSAAGAVGLLIGFTLYEGAIYGATQLVEKLKFEWVIDGWALLLSVASIFIVGVISGLSPALKAERLQVIESLRSE